MENIGICLPEEGYLEAVREICGEDGTLLIFDEVKTGHHRWLRRRERPSSVCARTSSRSPSRSAAASPSERSAGEAEYMDLITHGQGAPPRHVQREPARACPP